MNGVKTIGGLSTFVPVRSTGSSTSGRTWDEAAAPDAVLLARRFEAEWRNSPLKARRPELSEYLAEAGSLPGAKLALLRADMAMRWEAGEKVDVAWYRSRYPELEGETLVALIYEEFCLREEGDEQPSPDDYLRRYPEVSTQLRRVLDIHGLVGSGPTSEFHNGSQAGTPFPQAGETIAGFRLVEELGRGAFARVFLAEERQLADRPVALKVARTGSREPQTLARLQHTHIVPVHSYRTDPATNLHLLCMPYFGRLTLSRVLAAIKVREAKGGSELVDALDRLGPKESVPSTSDRPIGRDALKRRTFPQAIAWWGARMAEALEHAHARGVLHRDVKPSNVLITGDGMPMLLDFNLARVSVQDLDEAERVMPGGTLDYMSPEHLDELVDGLNDRVGPRSDVYGLGVLLYESVMGTKPFPPPKGMSSGTDLLMRAAEDRRAGPPALRGTNPDIPAALETVILRCLAPNSADRYASAADLATDLQAVADDRPLKYASEPMVERLYGWSRRNRRRLVAAGPILLAVVVMAGLFVLARRSALRITDDYSQNWKLAHKAYLDGLAFIDEGKVENAKEAFKAALTHTDHADPGRLTRLIAGGPSHPGPIPLAELKDLAERSLTNAERSAKIHAQANEFIKTAVPVRFLLTGFGRDTESASRSVMKAIAPFHVLGESNWTKYPDLELLKPSVREELIRDVNDVLFLWVVLLETSGKEDELQLGTEVCRKALRFVTPRAPWLALQARVERSSESGSAVSIKPDPEDARSAVASFQWGLLLDREGKYRDALEWFKNAESVDGENYWYHYYIAFSLDERFKDPDRALPIYATALALRSDSPWVRFCQARVLSKQQKFKASRDDFTRALRDFSKLLDAERYPEFEKMTRLELGYLQQSIGDLPGARAQFAWVLETDPKSRYAYAARVNMARVEADLGHPEEAIQIYDELIAQNPADLSAHRGRARVFMLQWRTHEAEAELSRLLQYGVEKQDRIASLRDRALVRLSLGRYEEAVADADEGLKLARHDLGFERLRTRGLLALGRIDEVVLTRPEELDVLPGQRPLRADLLRIATRLSAQTTRLEKTNRTAALNALLTRAIILSVIPGRHGEALDAANRAINLADLSARPYLTRAMVLRRAGQRSLARNDVKHVLTHLEPHSALGLELRGVLETEIGEPRSGLADIEEAMKHGGTRGLIQTERAIALTTLNDPRAGMAWNEVIRLNPEDCAAFLGRAEAFLARGQYDQAVADLERASMYWIDGRPVFGVRLMWTYARCLPTCPYLLPRIISVAGRTLTVGGSVTKAP